MSEIKEVTGLFIRKRYQSDTWQLFLGGDDLHLPSELYGTYFHHHKDIREDYEWVVLVRRSNERRHTSWYRIHNYTMAMVSCGKVTVCKDKEVGDWDLNKPIIRKEVECLSLWHKDEWDKTFVGSINNRICPRCYDREWKYEYYRGGT